MASILDLAAVISGHTGMDERIAWLQGKGVVHILQFIPRFYRVIFSSVLRWHGTRKITPHAVLTK